MSVTFYPTRPTIEQHTPETPRPSRGEETPTTDAPAITPAVLGRAELAQYLGVSAASLTRMISSGRVPKPLRLTRRPVWHKAEIDRWLAAGAPAQGIWERLKKDK